MWSFLRKSGSSSSSSAATSYPSNSTGSAATAAAPTATVAAGDTAFASRRLQKERTELLENPLDCVRLVQEGFVDTKTPEWMLEIKGAPGTLYQGETYKLRFRFPDSYPLESPEVLFVCGSPAHPHIYSNGHICLSILYDAWSPALGVNAICLSLISMLSSCKKKERPPDDSHYTMMCGSRVSPKQMKWIFHDDKV